MGIDMNTIQNLSQDYTGADGNFSSYGVGVDEQGVTENVNRADMKKQGAVNTGAEWAGMAKQIPVVGNFLTPFAAAAGFLKGSNDADFAHRDAVRSRRDGLAGVKSNNMRAALASSLSGADTLPTSQPTQIVNKPEPVQGTQTTDQLRSLGLA